ncbi:hypothetical protein Taro_037817 [Colocasia esculenta]|uniref:Uncharacterized protein n=1 Tax=Colocasia esculenta TaxID=4460 RepID=A0A843WQU4_COLES|nr:hypothetical protein [Colocasia esculenta]
MMALRPLGDSSPMGELPWFRNFWLCNACRSEKLASISLDAGISVGVHGWTLTPHRRHAIDANMAFGQKWWLVQWFEATKTTYYRAADYPHTLCLRGICSCSLDSWLYNFYSRLGVEDKDVGAPPEV